VALEILWLVIRLRYIWTSLALVLMMGRQALKVSWMLCIIWAFMIDLMLS